MHEENKKQLIEKPGKHRYMSVGYPRYTIFPSAIKIASSKRSKVSDAG